MALHDLDCPDGIITVWMFLDLQHWLNCWLPLLCCLLSLLVVWVFRMTLRVVMNVFGIDQLFDVLFFDMLMDNIEQSPIMFYIGPVYFMLVALAHGWSSSWGKYLRYRTALKH